MSGGIGLHTTLKLQSQYQGSFSLSRFKFINLMFHFYPASHALADYNRLSSAIHLSLTLGLLTSPMTAVLLLSFPIFFLYPASDVTVQLLLRNFPFWF